MKTLSSLFRIRSASTALCFLALVSCERPPAPLPVVNLAVMSDPASFRFVDKDSIDTGVQFYGKTAVGSRIAFVLDYSGSMDSDNDGDGKAHDGRRNLLVELRKTLTMIPRQPQKLVAVIPFADNAEILQVPDAESALGTGVGWYISGKVSTEAILNAANQRQTGAGTHWHPALNQALSLTPKPDLIYFMTDGGGAEGDLASVVKEITTANHADGAPAVIVGVCTVANPVESVKLQLERLAVENGAAPVKP